MTMRMLKTHQYIVNIMIQMVQETNGPKTAADYLKDGYFYSMCMSVYEYSMCVSAPGVYNGCWIDPLELQLQVVMKGHEC